MGAERLLSGHVLRIAVRRNRWHITLLDLRTGVVMTFDSFGALHAHLEQTSTWLGYPRPTESPGDMLLKRC